MKPPLLRIGINARLLDQPQTRGWNRYTVNLLRELRELGHTLILLTDRPLHPDCIAAIVGKGGNTAGLLQIRQAPRMSYWSWEQVWLPRQCKIDQLDVLHSPFHYGLPWSRPCPRVLTLHDAIDPLYYRRQLRWYKKLGATYLQVELREWMARHSADQIITVSNHSREDLIRLFGLSRDRVHLTYEAADPEFLLPVQEQEKISVAEKYGLKRPFLFYIGGWEKRKNLPFLLKAFQAANLEGFDLVLAGGSTLDLEALTALAQQLSLADQLRLLGRVTDGELRALYASASCFVYPSEYEGFGLQLCEAMALGCPVLAANSSCLPEILGDGGEIFSLNSFDALSTLIRKVALEHAFRAQLSSRALQRSQAFSWKRTAQETVAVYRAAITRRSYPDPYPAK